MLRHLVATVLILSLGTPCTSDAQSIPTIGDATCPGACTIAVRRVLEIGRHDDTAVVTSPVQIVQDRRGNVIVVWNSPGGPPSVFDPSGRLQTRLGRRGTGPGETALPMAVTIGTHDSVRLHDPNRDIDFGPDWMHVRTQAGRRRFQLQGNVVPFPNGSLIALGMEGAPRGARRAVHLQQPGGGSQPIRGLLTPADAGRSRVLAGSRDGRGAGSFWIGTYERNEGTGYDVYRADTSGRLLRSARRRPAWWHSDVTATTTSHVAVSQLVAIREVAPNVMAVLVAQPLRSWREIPFNTQTFAGVWNLYEGILEVIDLERQAVIGRARFPGYPRSILTDDRLAVYRELDDGTPLIEVLQFTLPRR